MRAQTLKKYSRFFHVSGKSRQSEWPNQNQARAWHIFGHSLKQISLKNQISTDAFVLMKNHYHWLCSIDLKSDSEIAKNFHQIVENGFQQTKPVMVEAPKVIELTHSKAYLGCYVYIYRNPVAAGIVQRAEHYRFSTLPYALGLMPTPLNYPLCDKMNLISNPVQTLRRIHQTHDLRYPYPDMTAVG